MDSIGEERRGSGRKKLHRWMEFFSSEEASARRTLPVAYRADGALLVLVLLTGLAALLVLLLVLILTIVDRRFEAAA
jgi:hypothetical protein